MILHLCHNAACPPTTPTSSQPSDETKPYHAGEVGDGGVFVGIWVKQHLGVGVDGDVGFHALLALAQKLGDGFDLRFGLREGPAVGVITGVGGCTLSWGEQHISLTLLLSFS